jgi:chemotaxis protein methyltransferase WspC
LNRQSYNIIFCRNVLIYFDSLSRKITLKNLNRLLKPEGIIFVGTSETRELANVELEIIRLNGVFVGQKKVANTAAINLNYSSVDNHQPKENKKNLTPKNTSLEISAIILTNTRTSNKQNPDNQDKSQQLLKPKARLDESLDTIRNLADEGNLTKAMSKCQSYLYQNSTNAEAYVLLGQVYQAQRLELEAEKCFQKAIYLDPKNPEALLHLTLLREEKGDIATANILRQRWQRLHKL